jgi:site-specific recombinase XerD
LTFNDIEGEHYGAWPLGHENIATTATYTHLTEPTRASLRKLLDKLMSNL